MKLIEFDFPGDPAAKNYCIFSDDLENNQLVLFHATPAANMELIIKQGFKIPDSKDINGLQSVSFAKRSVLALTHAMLKRQNEPGEYCIFVVLYENINRIGITNNIDDIYDYTMQPPPSIIGYCIVPSEYNHI